MTVDEMIKKWMIRIFPIVYPYTLGILVIIGMMSLSELMRLKTNAYLPTTPTVIRELPATMATDKSPAQIPVERAMEKLVEENARP